MSTYSLDKLLLLWKQGQLTVEQAIGHLLQHLAGLTQRVQHLEQQTQRQPRPPAPGQPPG